MLELIIKYKYIKKLATCIIEFATLYLIFLNKVLRKLSLYTKMHNINQIKIKSINCFLIRIEYLVKH